ncbi:MAG: YihA family ribosome biogenesis GTP-binding protein [Chitinophagaceae bacterium]|nr:YihA family ribosome biogenesis GTP-binding protein [Chitinophagaceae bacterium]
MQIKSARYIISSPGYEKCPVPDKAEYAFIGRSNVGKSSLINMLCNNEKLAKTSSAPGKTQLINHFEITSSPSLPAPSTGPGKKGEVKTDAKQNKWYLVDLPGYGFAKVSIRSRRRWEQMIENYLRKRENLSMVFVLIDARHSPQKIDLEFLEQLKKWQVPLSLVFTKSDKVNQRTVSKNVKDFLEAMKKTWQFLPQHFVSSALKKTGKDKILALIEEMNSGS